MFRYSENQKKDAIALCLKSGPKKAREVFGVSSTTLYRWMKNEGIDWNTIDRSSLPESFNDPFDSDALSEGHKDAADETTATTTDRIENNALVEALLRKIDKLEYTNRQLRRALSALLE